jgi:hypothetical protein
LSAELICPLAHRTFRLRRRPGTPPRSSLFGLSGLGSGLYGFVLFVRHLFSSEALSDRASGFQVPGITTCGSTGTRARLSALSPAPTDPGAVPTRLTIQNSKHLDGHTWQPGNGCL